MSDSKILGVVDLTTSFQEVYLGSSKQATGQLLVTGLDVNNTTYVEVAEKVGNDYYPKLTNFAVNRGQAKVLPMALGNAQSVHVRVRSAPTDLIISGITQANPGVITVNGTTGIAQNWDNFVRIAGVVGMTEVNGLARVRYLTGTTLTLLTQLAANEDTTGFTAYTSGGTISIIPAICSLIAYEEDSP